MKLQNFFHYLRAYYYSAYKQTVLNFPNENQGTKIIIQRDICHKNSNKLSKKNIFAVTSIKKQKIYYLALSLAPCLIQTKILSRSGDVILPSCVPPGKSLV